MKYLIVLFAVVACALAQYRPRPVQPQPYTPGKVIAILRQSQDVNFDGSYQYSYETENGISAQEQGVLKNAGSKDASEDVQGSFQYTAPDGQQIALQYRADENGFQPQGNHLPTPPPIPEAILKSLEYIRTHPSQEERSNQKPYQRF
ncbi:Cuticular protein 65Ec [Carabus blaptoides fortunei]